MKKYKATLTHNPQDYFDGTEPDELVETMRLTTISDVALMLMKVDDGYKAIVEIEEGDDSG